MANRSRFDGVAAKSGGGREDPSGGLFDDIPTESDSPSNDYASRPGMYGYIIPARFNKPRADTFTFEEATRIPHKADPKIGQPEGLSFAEKYVAPVLEAVGLGGNLRGSAIGGMMQGAADPGVAVVQKIANLTPLGERVNRAVQSEERKYQDARQEAGRDGLDLARAAGNAVITYPLAPIGGAPAVARSNPEYAAAQRAADEGWANLVRVENAAGRAVNNGGVFTPAQLNAAVRAADSSVRRRATARGQALMQDLATAGQNVLANRVPNSGTVDRALLVGMTLGAPVTIPAAAAASLAYSRPVQNALRMVVTDRPRWAPEAANYLRRLVGPAALTGVPALEGGN